VDQAGDPTLLTGKYRVPARVPGTVSRPRLLHRFEATARTALTVVAAPAGFGKTTALVDWLATLPPDAPPVAWLSLDHRDNDPRLFWTYLITAVRAAVDGVGAGALQLLAAGAPSTDAALAALLNDVGDRRQDLLLVLDDYHLIEAPAVHEGMAFLLEHRPPQLHLVLATRADPALPLARLRARGQLLEIRASDLRFTVEESAAYLNGPMELALGPADLAALDGRTEGWIAALQLAALSMRERDDVAGFIAGFAGDDRHVVDFLGEEVLGRQPDDVRDFLLRTSVLEQLTGPLCDAVTGVDGGRATLVALERANLFLVPLDDRRRWFRYHHLFADVLHAHLLDEQPRLVPELHRRASVWFAAHGDTSRAIDHALAGGDPARAADLMEPAMPAMARARREGELARWVRALPDDVVADRPVLGVLLAGALTLVSDLDTVARRLDDVERSVRAPDGTWPAQPPPGLVVVDPEGYRALPARIAMYRAAVSLAHGDLDATLAHAGDALALAPPDDHLSRASGGALAGLASLTRGDLDAAHAAYTEAVAGLGRVGFVSDVLGCSVTLGEIRRTQGRLADALHTYRRALDLSGTHRSGTRVSGTRASGTQGESHREARPDTRREASPSRGTADPLRGTADLHVAIAGVLLERDDRAGAADHLAACHRLGEYNGMPQHPHRWRVTAAALREAEGDLDAALDLLDAADRVYVPDFLPNVRPVPAVRARLRLRRGELDDAQAWVREQHLAPDDELSYLREYEHVTLARLLLARHDHDRDGRALADALGLLDRLLAAAEVGRRGGSALEILVLQALAHQAAGDLPTAVEALERAVALAQPEGWVRPVAAEGAPMAALLKALTKQRPTAAAYARRLLAATARGEHRPGPQGGVVEALSERELHVLQLLGTDLDGPDIARALSVSLNTLRTHTRNIYAKLGVTSRRAAVRQGNDLKLLPGAHRN